MDSHTVSNPPIAVEDPLDRELETLSLCDRLINEAIHALDNPPPVVDMSPPEQGRQDAVEGDSSPEITDPQPPLDSISASAEDIKARIDALCRRACGAHVDAANAHIDAIVHSVPLAAAKTTSNTSQLEPLREVLGELRKELHNLKTSNKDERLNNGRSRWNTVLITVNFVGLWLIIVLLVAGLLDVYHTRIWFGDM